MSEGEIPVNTSQLPIEAINMEDDQIYHGELVKFVVNVGKLDKNGNAFGAVTCRVISGDYEGMSVQHNYIKLPVVPKPGASKGELIRAHNASVDFGRMCRAFKIDGTFQQVVPGSPDFPQQCAIFQEQIEAHYGKTGKFSIENREFPAGSGKKLSSIKDWVFDN